MRGILEFYERNGLSWGAADLFALGRTGAVARLGEITAILSLFTRDGAPAFSEVTVVSVAPNDPALLSGLKEGFANVLRELRGRAVPSEELDAAFSAVRVVSPATLETRAAVHLVRTARRHAALVFGQAALYRDDQVDTAADGSTMPGDAWAPHLHALMEQAGGAAAEAECYVLLDAGETLPARPELRQLLLSVKHSAVAATGEAASPAMDRAAYERWSRLAASGDVGAAFAEVEAAQALSAREKALIRLLLFGDAGLLNEIKAALEAEPDIVDKLPPEAALQVAVLAEAAGVEHVAADLLAGALPEVLSCEQLESALDLAARLGEYDLLRAAEARLGTLFPKSSGLRRHRAEMMALEGRYDEAAHALRGDRSPEATDLVELWALFAQHLNSDTRTDAQALLVAVAERCPAWTDQARVVLAEKLEGDGRRAEALAVLVQGAAPDGRLDKRLALAALGLIQRSYLVRDQTLDRDAVVRVLGAVVEGLAHRPTDALTRVRLLRTLAPQVLGSGGVAMMAVVALSLAGRPLKLRTTRPVESRPKPCSEEALSSLLQGGAEWLGQRRIIASAHHTLPAELLSAPPDQLLAGLEQLITLQSERIRDADDRKALGLTLALATALAPHGSEPNEDLVILRVTASKLAHAGHVQFARDLAEQALTLASDDPRRARLAWLTFADVYDRVGNPHEALVALACALAAHDERTWEQVWYESMLVVRVFRDLSLVELVRPLLATARLALRELGLEARHGSRTETVELQIRLAEYSQAGEPNLADLLELRERITLNVRDVLGSGDELAPAATLLASVLREAESEQLPTPPATAALLKAVLEQLDPAARAIVEMAYANTPTIDQVVAFAARIEPARYAEDVGYDVHNLVKLARRLLASDSARDPVGAVYAIEALADRAITLPASGPENPARLIDSKAGPAEAACELSHAGLSVVALGIAEAGLVRVVAERGELQRPVIESATTFDKDRLRLWSKTYPYGYAAADDLNVFHVSTEGIGVSGLPARAVIVASTELQSFPPNLFNVGGDLAGRQHRLAAAPSLTWLLSARRRPFAGNGRTVAWIPTAEPDGGLSTLAIIAERLRESFARHGVEVFSASWPPDGTAGADLAVVAAHGGIGEGNRFFRVLRDDADLAIPPFLLARSLAEVGIVVLFVCSGGRIDRHPGASAVLGLVKQLLDQGSRGVVAPPWPLSTNVPPHWLPTFLHEWDAGMPVIDACFAANLAVRERLGDDPGKCLAMTVYGDPLARRTGGDDRSAHAGP